MKWLRWLAVIPSSIIAWYAMLIVGTFVVFSIGEHICPLEEIVSGHCMAWWYSYVEQATIYFFVALSAFFVVICAATVAPSHRMHVAWIAYFSGVVVAVYFAAQTSAMGEFIAAVLAGLLGVFSVAKYLRSHRLLGRRKTADIGD